MPGGSRSETIPLKEHDIAPAHMGQVVGNRSSDDAATDDDDSGTLWKTRGGHKISLENGVN
jgi:hypothetical protein